MFKAFLTPAVALAALAVAGTAGAVQPVGGPSVALNGDAEKFCTLPDSWTVSNASGGANASQFSGTTWNIPEALLSDASGQRVSGIDMGIRIRGTGVCNASHTIRLQSARGGLVTGTPGAATPDSFVRRVPVRYDAQWSTPAGAAFGANVNNFVPASPGQQSSIANFNVGVSQDPPGARFFDFRAIFSRPAGAAPMLAGSYSDNVTVTITLAP